ncbi:hypothetical protein CPT_Mater22 [Bacillus phage Mater]|uniref:Uncharacterized protein n=1 Tax=Bacillus phage Mater TaxID=1540090 RepID=A0A0A0RNF9_9CAUD|nr:hypothetical protein CPT_Mater22 [Bacillus phage Mater]AIW03179.1 hypothetical protein CPT_Mater22 [Bacillus phage Mater]
MSKEAINFNRTGTTSGRLSSTKENKAGTPQTSNKEDK